MSRLSSWMNNAATDFEGFSRWLTKLFRPGVATGWTVSQRGTGANMSVDIAAGDGVPMAANTAAWDWTTAVENVVIGAASVTNRRDIVVAYTDLSVTNPSTATPNNPGALKFMVVAGTAAASPADPSDATIQAAVGASNPFLKLARVSLISSTTQITNALITSLSTPIALNVQRLWGGSSNTLGHLVPNVVDGTVVVSTDTGTVGPALLSAGALTLGYAQITSTFSTSSTTPVQIPDLTVSVTIPPGGRRIKITVFVPYMDSSSISSYSLSIWDGVVNSGTQLANSSDTIASATYRVPSTTAAVVAPSAGAKTYNVGLNFSSANPVFAQAAANSPAFILVEAI